MNVDQVQADTSLTEAAAKCGVTLDAHGSGQEVRLDCSFGCQGDHCGRREIAVNTENPQKVFMRHAYQCGLRPSCYLRMAQLRESWVPQALETMLDLEFRKNLNS